MINILNKLKLQNKNANCCDKQCVLGQKSKTQQQQNKLSNIKAIAGAGAGNWTRELSYPKRMRYHCTTESTESNDCSQAI